MAAFRRTPKDALPSGGSELVLKKARPSASSRRKGVLRFLPKEGRPSASSRRKGVLRFLRLPSESFTSGGVALSEGSRRKRTSFGKLHLWRLPSESFTSGGFRRCCAFLSLRSSSRRTFPASRRKGTCFASFGFLRKASPLVGWRLSERSSGNGG